MILADDQPVDRVVRSAELDLPISELKAALLRSIAHPARIRVLETLAGGERTVSELQG